MTKNHMIVPPAYQAHQHSKNIYAAGRPVGVCKMESRSFMQKHMVIVRIQLSIPDTRIAVWIAISPPVAASWVSSDMLDSNSSSQFQHDSE